MRKRLVKLAGMAAALAVFVCAALPADASSISELKKQQQENEKRLNSVNSEISGLEGEKDAIGEEIEEIDAELVEIIASVEMIEDEIAVKEEQIAKKQVEYDEAKTQEEEQYDAMKLRIKFLYEKGETSYLEILLESKSFSEMVNKAEYVQKVYECDRKLLEEFKATKEKVEAIKNQLEDEKAELETSRFELKEEEANMQAILDEKKADMDNYEVQISKARQEAAAYKAKIKEQTAQIRKIEEEAARKAAEEAGRKAAQARKSGSSGGGRVSIPAEGSASGQAIASYACQFIGNPYVAGGTSLTEGADCSGFVWRVFKDCGYSVPRTSWDLRGAGTGVDYSQATPGDIVCYAGHVGIYIGNGCIVHASTQRTGIKITTATYKPIVAVRRVAS